MDQIRLDQYFLLHDRNFPTAFQFIFFRGALCLASFTRHVLDVATNHVFLCPARTLFETGATLSFAFLFPVPPLAFFFRACFFFVPISFYRSQGLFILHQFFLCDITVGWCRRDSDSFGFAIFPGISTRQIAIADFSVGFAFVNCQRGQRHEEEGKR
nr:hypothetical protein [Janthinobacterium sp. Marseille]